MKQETIKIQVLNDTKLCVLPVLPDMETVVPVESISGLTVSWGIHGHETEPVSTTIENGYIVLPISADMPLGVYNVHMQGLINGEKWSDNRYEMFELVKYGEGIRYDSYYTKTVILGLSDDTLQRLREELEQKIAEAEEAKEYAIEKAEEYKEKVLEIDDLARKTDLEPLAKTSELEPIGNDVKGNSDMLKTVLNLMHCDDDNFINEIVTSNGVACVLSGLYLSQAHYPNIEVYYKWTCLSNVAGGVYYSPAGTPIEQAKVGDELYVMVDGSLVKTELTVAEARHNHVAMVSDLAKIQFDKSDLAKQADLLYVKGAIKLGPLSTIVENSKGITQEAAYDGYIEEEGLYKFGVHYLPETLAPGDVVYKAVEDESGVHYVSSSWRIVSVEMSSLATNADTDALSRKLDIIIANTSLTAAQADEDWQNVQPITE